MAFVSGLFLAAGLSYRYGSQKLLLQLPCGGVAECAFKHLMQSSVDEIIVVTGNDYAVAGLLRDAAAAASPKQNIIFTENPRPSRGMASSAKIGIHACSEQTEGFLFMLADCALIPSYYINRIIEEFVSNPSMNIVPYYAGKQGHPVIINSRWRRNFSADRGNFGGRKIISRHPDKTKRIDFLSSLPALDIDREEDHRNALESWGRQDEAVLTDILDSPPERCISISGGGGKTSFMIYAAELLSGAGRSVCMTTTTKLRTPEVTGYGADRVVHRESIFSADIRIGPEGGTKLLWLGSPVEGTGAVLKYRGPGIDQLKEMFSRNLFNVMLIEADGSAGKPLKVPGKNEPVIPDFVNLCIAVIGLSALGKPADETVVHRIECLENIAPGLSTVTEDVIEMLIDHPEGSFKNAPEGSEKLLVCNQCDVLPEKVLQRLIRRLPGRVSVPDFIAFTSLEPAPCIISLRSIG